MCGICGIYNFGNKKPVESGTIEKMCNIIKHRGPDDKGIYTEKNFGFGMRRLSIIDLQTGNQPIFNEDKSISVILNGEIYNFQELREELEKKNHKFHTKSDTETIVHLYEEYGHNCVLHMRGMFAFALWDKKNDLLFIARDRLGKKPLYWTQKNGSFIFASEIKAILAGAGMEGATPEINLSAIDLYLTYQYIPSPMTIFKNIHRLPPASYLVCSGSGIKKIEKYWHLDFTKKTSMTFPEACNYTRQILTEATKLRMISDVPLGAFLSGGHDSSIVVGLMSHLSSAPIKTFSIGFEDEAFSELPYARLVADRFKTEHHELIVKPQFVEILPKIIWHYDQPFADTSALPSYYVSEITRKHVKVALNGDGGDENFGGYLRYKAMKGTMYFSSLFA
ncbi:MAG: asparagine synthase (glutamine-hydrolyzing), partial [Elusimicrobia bacterium]|nr:asparagine synthase (glutamine-hydrolyzing) [Elusimicrobiota bacterium]